MLDEPTGCDGVTGRPCRLKTYVGNAINSASAAPAWLASKAVPVAADGAGLLRNAAADRVALFRRGSVHVTAPRNHQHASFLISYTLLVCPTIHTDVRRRVVISVLMLAAFCGCLSKHWQESPNRHADGLVS